MEAIRNPAEHPDQREPYEQTRKIRAEHLEIICQLTGMQDLQKGDSNPLYQPEPASDFYRQTLAACWSEAWRVLKPGGLMAFTFHHSEDAPWIDVLESLFEAGYILVATYPIRSDETKGEKGAFGSRTIEYDIIHVCRKRLQQPEPVSWARMRRWVKEEAQRLKQLVEREKDLPEADIRVILRGKSLEFYSRHYGQVFTGENEPLAVRDALAGINIILDDLMESSTNGIRHRPPDDAEPITQQFLRIFQDRTTITRDHLHKILRGTGYDMDDFTDRRWIQINGTKVEITPINQRFRFFTAPGRNRKVIKSDLDQTHFLIGAASEGSGVKITNELERQSFVLKKSVDGLLQWYAAYAADAPIRQAAQKAYELLTHWRAQQPSKPQAAQLHLFEES